MSNKSLGHQSYFYFIGRLIAFILSVFVPIVLVRVFTKIEYGIYTEVLLIYTFFLKLLQLGLKASILYFLPKYPEFKKEIVTNTTIIFLILGFLIFLATIFFRENIGYLFNTAIIIDLMPYCGIYILLMLITVHFESILISETRAEMASFIVVITALMRSMFVLIFVIYFGTIKSALYALISYSFIRLILFIIVNKYNLSFSLSRKNIDVLKLQLNYTLPLAGSGVVGVTMKRLDRILVSTLFTPEMYAIYNIGKFKIPLMDMLINSIGDVSLPKAVSLIKENKRIEFLKIWNKMILSVSYFGLGSFFLFQIISKDFITLLFTENYVDAVPVFRIILIIMLIQMLYYGIILRAIGKTKFIFYSNLFGFLVCFPMIFLGIKYFGLVGGAFASVIVFCTNAFSQIYYTLNSLNISLAELYPIKSLLKICIISIIMSISLFYFQTLFELKIIRILFSSSLFLIGYVYLTKKLNILNFFQIPIIQQKAGFLFNNKYFKL